MNKELKTQLGIVGGLILKSDDLINDGLTLSAQKGFVDAFNYFKDLGADNYSEALLCATRCGHIDIVKLCNVDNYCWAIASAAFHGQIDILKFLKGFQCDFSFKENSIEIAKLRDFSSPKLTISSVLDWAMDWAAKGGQTEIVKYCKDCGATNFNVALHSAAYYGHDDVMKLLKELGATDFNCAMVYAMRNNKIEMANLCKEWGVTDNDEILYALCSGTDLYRILNASLDPKNDSEALLCAIEKGDIETVKLCNLDNVCWALARAALYGQIEILEFLKDFKCDFQQKGQSFSMPMISKFDWVMNWAAKGGHINIVKLCKEWGATDFNSAACSAANGEIVKLLKDFGANDFNRIMISAIRNNKIEIVKLCKEWGAANDSHALKVAVLHGNIEIMKLLGEESFHDCFTRIFKDNFNEAMTEAARCGNVDIVKLLKDLGANDFNEAMKEAARSGHITIVKLCKQWGATDFESAMVNAAGGGHLAIVKLCEAWGVNDFDQAIESAVRGKFRDIINFCRECQRCRNLFKR